MDEELKEYLADRLWTTELDDDSVEFMHLSLPMADEIVDEIEGYIKVVKEDVDG